MEITIAWNKGKAVPPPGGRVSTDRQRSIGQKVAEEKENKTGQAVFETGTRPTLTRK
jgi:hypothetical protein